MRNQFKGNLVLGALKKKKLLRLQKKHSFYHFWNFEKFFLQFSKFCNQILDKNLFGDYYNFLIIFNKKQTNKQTKTEQEKSIDPYFYFAFVKTRGP